MGNGTGGFSPSNNHLGVNVAFAKFLFVVPRDPETIASRVRAAGSQIARGFFNDFDADGARDVQPHETIHFLVAADQHPATDGVGAAQYAVQVCDKYRPRLEEVEVELRRRLGDAADVLSINGAERARRHLRRRLRHALLRGYVTEEGIRLAVVSSHAGPRSTDSPISRSPRKRFSASS